MMPFVQCSTKLENAIRAQSMELMQVNEFVEANYFYLYIITLMSIFECYFQSFLLFVEMANWLYLCKFSSLAVFSVHARNTASHRVKLLYRIGSV